MHSFVFALLVAAQSPAAPAPKDLVLVRVRTREELARLVDLASDVDDHAPLVNERAKIHADEDEQARLRRAGFELEVVQKDLARFYAERAASESAQLGAGSMGGFRTLAEIGAELDRLASTYPSIVSPKFSIGASVQGRPIWAIRISDNPLADDASEPVAWFDALHHAREPMGGEALLLLADWLCTRYPSDAAVKRMVETRQTVLVPCVNPDGYEHNRSTDPGGGGLWRKNRRNNGDGTFGVDLNRNWGWEWGPQHPGSSGVTSDETYRGPSAFSEPETRAIRDALLAHPPGMAVSAHTYSDLWLYAWSYDTVVTPEDARFQDISQRMTASNGYAYGTPWQLLYIANGGSLDWGYGQLGSYFFSPEIGSASDGFWPAPSQIASLFEDVRQPFLDIIRWTSGWAEKHSLAWTEANGDGDAYLEPGETWDLAVTLANGGVDAVSGLLTLASVSTDVDVLVPSRAFSVPRFSFPAGALSASPAGPHTPATEQLLPLRVQFAPSASVGAPYTLALGIEFDGLATSEPLSVNLGAPRELARDDMEIASFGWQVSNALNYSWQRAAPQQTTSGSQTAQPGNDDPSGAGTQCWVTGAAAGASAGTNDVDGTTVLTSPRFHTSGFAHVELAYARWFACLPGSAQDDRLLVEVSNDDGGSWTVLENPANDNAWRTMRFDLESALPLTDRMRVRFTAADSPNNDLTEACVDSVVLRTFSQMPTLGVWGATASGNAARLYVDGPANKTFQIRISGASQGGTAVPGIAGLDYLGGTPSVLASGTTDASGHAAVSWTVGAGTSFFLQVTCDPGGAEAAFSNLLSVGVP